MSGLLEAYVGVDGEGWFVTPIIYAGSAEAAFTGLCEDEQPEDMVWLEGAEGLQDLACADLHALLHMSGVVHQYECRGCTTVLWSEWQHNDAKRMPLTDWDQEELRDAVRVEGVGLFCSRECWERYAARQVTS